MKFLVAIRVTRTKRLACLLLGAVAGERAEGKAEARRFNLFILRRSPRRCGPVSLFTALARVHFSLPPRPATASALLRKRGIFRAD